MNRKIAVVGSLAVVSALGSAAQAQDASPPERPATALADAIEVVARGYEASAATAVPRMSHLDAADIERRQAASVADMLTEVPGAYVLRDGPSGQFSRLFLRGAASNQTLVLVDGIPQNDATAGGLFDFNDLGTAGVERIDVLRGSYGVLYGSEAVGGVVAITTRRGRGPWRGFARVEAGSFSTHREALGAGGGDDDFDFWATLEDEGTHGERAHEHYDAQAGSARLGFAMGPRWRADVSLRVNESEVESPFDFPSFGSTVLPDDSNIERRRDTLASGVTLTHLANSWLTARLAVSYLRVESDFENGPDPGDRRDELLADNRARDLRSRLHATAAAGRALGWRAREDGGVDLDVHAGFEWLGQDSDSSTTFPNFGRPGSTKSEFDRETDTLSAFTLAEARLPDAGALKRGVLAAGVRRDRHDVFGGETSPFAGGRVDVAPTDTTLRTNWGQGFRAPKPAELDDPSAGNTELGPETSRSFDVGATQTLLGGAVEVGATWFRLDTNDLIAFDPTATSPARPFGQLVNFQRTRTTGWELEGRADVGAGFALRAAYTHQNPRDEDTGLPLPNRARAFWSAGVAWERGPVLLSLDAYVSEKIPHLGGEFTHPDGDAREAPGRQALVNLTARWRATDHLTVFARVENLLDDEWVATPTSPAGAPLGVYAGLQLDF